MPDITPEEFQFRAQVLERLSSIESYLRTLAGNGQPGRIDMIESDIRETRERIARDRGFFAGISATIAAVVSIVVLLLKELIR